MRAVVQRVKHAKVTVEGAVVGSIGEGLLVLVAATHDDTGKDARAIAEKVAGLRVFSDDNGQMNLSLADVSGGVMVISQFTLYGAVARGRRPSFTAAAPADHAQPLIELVATSLAERGLPVARGSFGAKMDVELVNEGPVTIFIETLHGRVL
ncbi:MAG TPA: D-aminoacyl-tRNA deacylase [Acidimicrobiia bacterium]|nr:D-aminoacyl-tRNA deacylase [Acidimicrobiia bacterium]